MTAFIEEMKQNLYPTWRTLEKGGNQGRKLLLSLKGIFLMNSGGSILITVQCELYMHFECVFHAFV